MSIVRRILAGAALIAAVSALCTADAGEASRQSMAILGDPSLVTCPTSNCPAPPLPPVLSTFLLHGSSTKGSKQSEWLSNIGFFVRTGSPQGQKVAQYIGVMQQQGGGTTWALNTDLVRNAGLGGADAFGGFEGSGKPGRPGAVGIENGSIGYELDFTNWDSDSAPGVGSFTVGQYVHAQGSFTSLAAIYMDANMDKGSGKSGWSDGILFNGDRLIKDNTIHDASTSTVSLNVSGTHQIGLNTSLANADMHAIVLRKGQTACFDGLSDCLSFNRQKVILTNKKGEEIFSIDENGNAYFKGHVFSR